MIALLGPATSYSVSPQCIADDSSTSAQVLHQLSTHNDVEVRMAVADNRNTQLQTFMQLALDESSDLRYALAENHNVGAKVLELLTMDTNPYVVSRAKRTLARLQNSTARSDSIADLFARSFHQKALA